MLSPAPESTLPKKEKDGNGQAENHPSVSCRPDSESPAMSVRQSAAPAVPRVLPGSDGAEIPADPRADAIPENAQSPFLPAMTPRQPAIREIRNGYKSNHPASSPGQCRRSTMKGIPEASSSQECFPNAVEVSQSRSPAHHGGPPCSFPASCRSD